MRSFLVLIGCVLVAMSGGLFLTELCYAGPPERSEGPAYDLERFMPEGLHHLYHSQPCKIDVAYPCTLWVADEQDARYVILRPDANGMASWREDNGADVLVRAVVPETCGADALRIELLRKFSPSDPNTFSVQAAGVSGRVQMIEQTDEVLLVWMPDSEDAVADFKRVDVTVVATPPPLRIREITVPNQPDIIAQDSVGYLWFSAWGNEIYRLDPKTDMLEPMTNRAATGTPDGLFVDSRDYVWYGGYMGRYMGGLTPDGHLEIYHAPYSPSNPAIPCEAPTGEIWITDHPANRITEFDPDTATWGRSITMPVASAWVTQCAADRAQPALWMTMYNASSLGRLDLASGRIDRYTVPCRPAFLVLDRYNSVWTGCWDNGHIVQFDPITLSGVEYIVPNAAQVGGMSINSIGQIVFAQNTLGRVGVLDPKTLEVYYYQLPSRPMFKDSVFVDWADTIWAPSPFRNLIGKVVPGF